MAVQWTEDPVEGMVLTATSVQDLVDELEANPRTMHEAKRIVCGTIEIQPEKVGVERGDYCVGVLQGLKIAQELGVP
jgi:hypothetical protein